MLSGWRGRLGPPEDAVHVVVVIVGHPYEDGACAEDGRQVLRAVLAALEQLADPERHLARQT